MHGEAGWRRVAGPGHGHWATAGVALSLANLCFLNVWQELLDPTSTEFFRKAPASGSYLPLTLTSILLLAAVLFVAGTVVRRAHGPVRVLGEVLFLVTGLIPLNILRTRLLSLPAGKYWPVAVAGAIVGVWILLKRRRAAVLVFRRVLLVLLPLLPLGATQVIVQHLRANSDRAFLASRRMAPSMRPGQARRLTAVWVIFDEFDDCLAFSRRSPDIRLPELDRLRAEAVSGRARPAGGNTITAIPSLFTGKIVQRAEVAGLEDLKLYYRDSPGYRLWSKEPNVLAAARAHGFNTGVAGWFFPYCRLFPTTACEWQPIESVLLREDYQRYLSFPESVRTQLTQQLVVIPALLAIRPSLDRATWATLPAARKTSREHAIREYNGVHEAALRLLRARDMDLLFFHWPVPHPLYYFDRHTGDFTVRDGPNYFDALALVDRTVGDIRGALEREGRWDETALLVSSDHPLRSGMRHSGYWTPEEERAMGTGTCSYVPFLLKMPGQRNAIRLDREFGAVVSGELLLGVLGGEIRSADDAAKWLARNGGTGNQR